jgi:two-component system phosphate regulon sensor histidine kinase PhoR
MATLLPKAQKAKVQLHLDCPASIEPVRLDSQRIDSVVLNLIDNAIKYNHSGGWVKISIRQTLEFTFIYVEDNGPGIPEQVQHRVFERFFRVDKIHTRLGGGFGLGLAIVKHIVHAHGGQIYLKSELKSGTVFTVRLPRQVSEEMIDNRLQL